MKRDRIMAEFGMLALLGVLALGAREAPGQVPPPQGAEEWKAPARAAKKKNPVPADEKSIAAGKAVYIGQCFSCHGATGKGDGPAAKDLPRKAGDLSNPKMDEQSDGALFWKITEGRTPMPTYEKLLKEEDRWAVVNYVRTLVPREKKEEGGKQ
jgi:mono/diheme cytochrome c family protein